MGRIKIPEPYERVRTVSFKIDVEKLRMLDYIASKKGLTRSDVIREAIDLYLKMNEKLNHVPYKVVKLTS